MSMEERRRLDMLERLTEVVGADVADTVLAHLPPPGEGVVTAAQIESLRADSERRIESLRAETEWRIESLRADTEQRIESLRTEMHQLFELQGERLAARWRRNLLLLAVPQFLVLLGIVVSLNI